MKPYLIGYAIFMTIWVIVQPLVFKQPHYDCKKAAEIAFEAGSAQGIGDTVRMFRGELK